MCTMCLELATLRRLQTRTVFHSEKRTFTMGFFSRLFGMDDEGKDKKSDADKGSMLGLDAK